MPIDVGTAVTLTGDTGLFANPSGWGSRAISLLSKAFGGENRFESAALRDAVEVPAEGQVPVIGDRGLAAAIGDATTELKGLVTTGAVANIESITALANLFGSIIGANIEVRNVPFVVAGRSSGRSVVRFQTSDRPSIILISPKGQDDPISFQRGNNNPATLNATLDGDDSTEIWLNAAGGSVEYEPDGTIAANNLRELRLAPISGHPRATGLPVHGVYLLDQARLDAFSFTWAAVFKYWGAQGNDGVLNTNPDQPFAFNNRMRTRGVDADLFIAFKRGSTNIYHRSSSPRSINSNLIFRSNSRREGRGAFVVEILL